LNPSPEILPEIVYGLSLFCHLENRIENKQNSDIPSPLISTIIRGEITVYLDNMTPSLPIESQQRRWHYAKA